MTTSSVDAVHTPLDIVHLKVAEAPTVKAVTPEVAEEGVVTVAEPETTDHAPVPELGVFPANVAVVTLHKV